MSRRNAILVSSAVACLVLASTLDVRAEEFEKKFRLAFSLGAYSTTDTERSPSANVRTVLRPNGEIEDNIYDPQNDSAAFAQYGIESQNGVVLSASYAFTRLWYVEASVGYRRGNVGKVELEAQFDGTPIPTDVQAFNFTSFSLNGGTMNQIPVQLTAGIRFRPKATLNPYLCAGVGYSFISFTPSDEINRLSSTLGSSTGSFVPVRGGQRGGEGFDEALAGPSTALSGITVDVQNAPEWHFGGGLEFSFKSRWVVFVDARYSVYSGTFGMTVNGADELGISVPNDQIVQDSPGWNGPFGAFRIPQGLVDGGSWVAKKDAPPNTTCTHTSDHSFCELTGPPDGQLDPGLYYVHAGKLRFDGASLQIGIKFTF